MTPEQLETYRATAKARREAEAAALEKRRQRAWSAAEAAAELLRSRFGATGVVVFGSLVEPSGFGRRSDIDLAVEGIALDDYFLAVAALEGVSREFEFDLVDLERCPVGMREVAVGMGRSL